MITPEPASFFQSFNFDTLLAIISCIAGVIALFLGGSAYRNYRNVKSLNDKKEYNDSSTDSSQKAGGDIYNQTCDVAALSKLTKENFEICLRHAYEYIDQRNRENLHEILKETNRLIKEKSVNIASYTKIDWINIYFESAKNASDTYMQKIWAKVLAKELESPGSFSFKTLDILKNMSAEDFMLFEKLCSLQIDSYILGDNFTNEYISWKHLLQLSELGLINLDNSTRTFDIKAKGMATFSICNECYVIIMRNETDNAVQARYRVYPLTSAATELLCVASFIYQREYIIKVAKQIRDNCNAQAKVGLHKVNFVSGINVNYNLKDLLSDDNISTV